MRNTITSIFRSWQHRQTLAAFASILLLVYLACYAISVYFSSASDMAFFTVVDGSANDILLERSHQRTMRFVLFSVTVCLGVGLWLGQVFWRQIRGQGIAK